jgi:hypothetical protein
MSNCTFDYIEARFRNSDPERADYFNNMGSALWRKINESLLFNKKVGNNKTTYKVNADKTLKRRKQESFINDINNELNAPIVSINTNDNVEVNLKPLFGEDLYTHVEKVSKISSVRYDISPYIAQGYDIKGSIIQMVHDLLLDNRNTYTQTKDEFGKLIPGSYIINPNSEKVTRAENPEAASKQIVKYLEDKIEAEFPGVKVISDLDSYPIKFKVSPWTALLNDYKRLNFNEQTRGEQDKTVREKYFSEGNFSTDKEILTKIAESQHPLNKVAEQLIPFSKGVKIELLPLNNIEINGIKASGVYTTFGPGTEEYIQIAEFSRFKGLGSEPTIIHEIVHSLTVNWLDTVDKKDPLYKEFEKLYNETVSKLGEENLYALTNIKEFAVALFTDADFINKLRNLPSDNSTKYSNLLESIFSHILKLFKITDNKSTLYKESFAVVSNIINAQKDLEENLISNFNEFENLQDDLANYYIDDYSEYTNVPENLFEEEIIAEEITPKEEIKTNLIPDNLSEQFDEYNSIKNKDAETTEEFDKQVLYSLILPNINKDKFFKIFSQTDPKEFESYRQSQVKSIINTFAEKFGITIEQINQYQDRYVLANNKTLSYNGVANLANKTIKYIDGDTNALTEEVAHFMVAMLSKNSPEYLGLKNYISRTPEYQLYYESYLEVYNGDVDKTEEEIMGKVVANSLLGVTENTPLSLKSIIVSILNYINDLFNPEYRKDFQISVDNINHLFFTENFDTNFSEANISFDELYSLDFGGNVENEKVFNYSTDQILENTLINLRNQRQRFIENKQTELVKSIDTLIEIVTDKNTDIDNSDRIINYVKMSLIEIQKVNKAFNDFKNSKILQDLEKRNFNNLTREEQEKQTQEDRLNNLNYIAAAITTLQNLNLFIELIEWNFAGFNQTYSSLSEYIKIINTLPDSYENSIFKEALELTKPSHRETAISSMKGVYQNLSQQLLDISFKTLNTSEQRNFLELTQKNLTPNVKNQEDINNDISILGTIKDTITGKFNTSTAREFIMPTNFQSDLYLQAVDNANAAFRQYSLMASAKDSFEYSLIQEKLNQLGVFDESWPSAKDDEGNLTFKLLQKYNFKLFKKSLSSKIVNEHLVNIINYDTVLAEVADKNPDILKAVVSQKYNSPNALKDTITKLYSDKKISKSLYLFLINYINGYETLYTLKLSEVNNNLSNINKNNLTQFKNSYISQLENNLKNLNFNKKSLPFFNSKFSFTDNTISKTQLGQIAFNILDNKKDTLIKRFVTVPKKIEGKDNPVYQNQLAYVEGLLNYFKNNIGYLEDIEGNIKTDFLNYSMLGEEFFFNLSDKNSVEGINFIDKNYKNLETLANSSDLKQKEIANLKLSFLEKVKKDNMYHNVPSNTLGDVMKNNNAAYLSNSKQYRELYNRIFRIIIPAALTVSTAVNPLASVMLYFTYRQGLDTLIYKPWYFIRNNPEEKSKFKKVYKAFLMSFKEGVKTELREKNINNNKELEKEVITGFRKILFNLTEELKNKINKNRITNNNILLLGEYKIPKPFEKGRENLAYLSTDFVSNQKTIVQARYNYETNIRWESWIRMVGDYQETRSGVTNSNIITLIKDRYWFNKFYKPSGMMSALRFVVGGVAGKLLKGNIQSSIMNFIMGQYGVFLFTNATTLPKTWINLLNHNLQMLAMGTNLDNAVNSLIGLFGSTNNPNVRVGFFEALKNMLLGRDTNNNRYLNNSINYISKNLRRNRGTGFIEYDETESILTRELNLTNTQALQNIGEKLIEQTTIFQYLNSNPIIDENGNPIKNLKKYFKVENGILTLDTNKLPKNLYLKNSVKLAYKNYYNFDINSDVNIVKITPKQLGLQPLTNVEINQFLNMTMLDELSNLMDKSQGVYNIFNKSYWRNTYVGLLFLQFKDHVLPGVSNTVTSKKVKNNFTSYETGVLDSLAKALDRTLLTGARVINKDIKFNHDVDQNLLIINNVSKFEFLSELNFVKSILNNSLLDTKSKVNTKLKNLAKDNEKFRKDTKRLTSNEIISSLNLGWYLKNIKDKSEQEISNNIKNTFNLKINNPKADEQFNFIKSLISKKFETKNNLSKEDINKLDKFDIDQNYIDIVQGYLKLKTELSGDVESINKLINFAALSITMILILGFLKSLDWPKEVIDEAGNKKLSFKDWLIATGEYGLSSLLLNYIPIDIDDAYGLDYKNFRTEWYKLSPTLSQLKDITDDIETGYEEKMLKTPTKKNLNFLLQVREDRLMNFNTKELPLLKPKVVYDEETDTESIVYGETLLMNQLLKLPVNKELVNNFPEYSEDKKKAEKLKEKELISLLAEKALINRAFRFGDRPSNKTKEEEEEMKETLQEYQEEVEALIEEYNNK